MIHKTLRCLAAAGLCLAAAACSKDDITPEPAPQQGITPTKPQKANGPRATWSISVRMVI